MTDAKAVDRVALIKEAVEKGFSEESLQRQPTYTIMSMIAQKKRQKEKTETKPSINELVTKAHQELTHDEEEDFDDTKTVVDMSHMTNTTNPADQKYKRFTFLVAAKNDLVNAIKTNSGLLQANMEHLDEDDVLTVQKEIAGIQHQLNLVNTEIREIFTWFREVNQAKAQFYEQFLKKSSDMSGNMTTHFQRKMANIEKYMTSMNQQNSDLNR